MNQYVHYTDQELCHLLKQGDRQAFDAIYVRYWESLYLSANRLIRLPAQAEDIIQDIFVNLWLKRAEYSILDLHAYLLTAVRFRVLNYIRRDKVKESFYIPFNRMQEASFGADELVREKELLQLILSFVER